MIALLWSLLSTSGCVIERLSTRSDDDLAAHREKFTTERMQARVAASHTVVERMMQEQDEAARRAGPAPVFDVLILSGGGDYGAFGAGVLKGWGTVRDPAAARPVFDAVSGVSTGALIAPLAFVGTEDAYERAFQVYQNPKPDWFKVRGLLTFLFTRNSFVDNTGLKNQIKETLDDDIVRQIAQGAAEKRLLVVGTTNMDMGMLAMWGLGEEAEAITNEGKPRDRFDSIVLASASIPGAFPPVEIDGDLYVDGGVTRNIAYTTDQDYSQSAMNVWKREHPDRRPAKIRYWVIVNNQLGTRSRDMHPGWPALMQRSLEMCIRSSTLGSLKSLALAMEIARTERGFDVEYRFMAIPDDWKPPVEGSFQKETMTSLAQLGYKLGSDPSNWRQVVPNPESPEP